MGQFNLNILETEPTIIGKITQLSADPSSEISFSLKSTTYSENSLLSDYDLHGNSFNKLVITDVVFLNEITLKHDGVTISTGNIPYQIDIAIVEDNFDLIPDFKILIGIVKPVNLVMKFKFYITDSNNIASNITETLIYFI